MKPFPGKGDGSDESAKIQGWLDDIAGDVGEVPAGTFCHSQALIVRSDTEIRGAGKSRSILKCIGEHGIRNDNLVIDSAQGPRVDRNISLRGIGFHGVPDVAMPHYSDFVTFCGVDGLEIRECAFAHRQLDGIVTANNYNMRIADCEFFDLGTKTLPAQPGTGQFVGGTCIFCWRPSYRAWLTGNYIHDCLGGGGIWLPVSTGGEDGDSFHVHGNTLINLAEFGIWGAPRNAIISGNIIAGIRNVDVDGHGMGLVGHGWSASNNDISSCDCAGIQLYNVADVSVCSNHIRDCNKLGLGFEAIRILSFAPAAIPGTLPPHDSCIRGNWGSGGIGQYDSGGGPMSNMDIAENHWQTTHKEHA